MKKELTIKDILNKKSGFKRESYYKVIHKGHFEGSRYTDLIKRKSKTEFTVLGFFDYVPENTDRTYMSIRTRSLKMNESDLKGNHDLYGIFPIPSQVKVEKITKKEFQSILKDIEKKIFRN